MKNCIVSFIYPEAQPFFDDFCASLNSQTSDEFLVLLFNDGVTRADSYFHQLRQPKEIIPVDGNGVGDVRFKALQCLKARKDLACIIFQDMDDQLSRNRVEVSLDLLQNYDLVCNDLSTFDASGNTSSSLWSSRLENNFEFDASFIERWNIVGLGNTAIRKSLLERPFHHSKEVLAYDWFLFYQLMKNNNTTAVFTTSCQTLYRQYAGNNAGIPGRINEQRMAYAVTVAKTHYTELILLGYDELRGNLQQLITGEFKKTISLELEKPIFWWEETTIYED